MHVIQQIEWNKNIITDYMFNMFDIGSNVESRVGLLCTFIGFIQAVSCFSN